MRSSWGIRPIVYITCFYQKLDEADPEGAVRRNGSQFYLSFGLMALNRETLARAESSDQSDRVVLDMDSSESPVDGQQEGSSCNGHFESTCYHPLFLFNSHGDCLAAKLRSGNAHSA